MLSVIMPSVAMLSFIMSSAAMLSVIMPSVAMLKCRVAAWKTPYEICRVNASLLCQVLLVFDGRAAHGAEELAEVRVRPFVRPKLVLRAEGWKLKKYSIKLFRVRIHYSQYFILFVT